MKNFSKCTNFTLVVLITILISACATSRPILAPNAHYKQVGKEQAEKDITKATKLADNVDFNSTNYTKAAVGTVSSTAVGAGIGVATGAIAGSGLGIGSITGAAGGLAGTLFWFFDAYLYMGFIHSSG